LRIEPAEGTFAVGNPVQLSLFGTTIRGGTNLIPASMAQWSSANPAVAELSRQGKLTPRRPGQVTVTASYGGQVAKADFSVNAPADA
jgi:hypothetical protein